MAKKLILGEKREAMCDMAAVLGDRKLGANPEALNNLGKSQGYLEGETFLITWAAGHLYERQRPLAVNVEYGLKFKVTTSHESYRMEKMRDIKKIPRPDKKRQLSTIKSIMERNDYDEIIIATDADAEGEVIAWDVLDNIKHKSVPVKRFWNTGSFKTKDSVDKALREIKSALDPVFVNLRRSGESRGTCDYLVGMKCTKAQTDAYGRLYVTGRLQTTLLGIYCKRELEIKNFIPKPYWDISGELGSLTLDHFFFVESEIIKEDGSSETGQVKETNYFIRSDLDKVLKDTGAVGGRGKIVAVEKSTTFSKSRPLPFSGGEFASEMMGKYKVTYDQANDLLDYLRNEGFTTYPGTNGNYFAKTDAEEVEKAFDSLITYFKGEKGVPGGIRFSTDTYIFNDKKAATQNHTPLNVTGKLPTESDLVKWEKASLPFVKEAFELIAKRILVAFLPDDKIEKQLLQVSVANHLFQATGERAIEQGWRTFMGMEKADTTFSTAAKVGDDVTLTNIKANEHKTQKPKKFTVKSTLDLMANIGRAVDEMIAEESDPVKIAELKRQRKILKEAKGIGTDRTRQKIIESLAEAKTGYIKISGKNQEIDVQKVGWDLNAIQPPEIKDVTLTARWEEMLEEIRRGTKTANEFITQVDSLLMDRIVPEILKGVGTKGVAVAAPKPATVVTETKLLCPKCNSPIVSNEVTFKCSTNSFQGGKATGCPFTIFRSAKLLGKNLQEGDLKTLLEGGSIIGENGNFMVLDLNEKYFTKMTFGKSTGTAAAGTGSAPANSGLVEMPKSFQKNGKNVWKEYMGAKITKAQAEKILDGGKALVTFKKKDSSVTYKKLVFLDGDGKMQSEFEPR